MILLFLKVFVLLLTAIIGGVSLVATMTVLFTAIEDHWIGGLFIFLALLALVAVYITVTMKIVLPWIAGV